MLKIKKDAPITTLLIAINIVIYIADHAYSGNSLFSGSVSTFSRGLLLSPERVISGEYWVLLTATFLHANSLHLGMNMLSLWQMGPIAEELLGRTRFLLMYLLAGIGGWGVSLFHKALTGVPSASLGASGAIFGVMGVFFAIVWVRSRDSQEFLAHPYIKQSGTNIVLFTLATALAGILIDHYAHFGGFLVGGAFTVFFCRFRVSEMKKHIAAAVLVAVALVGAYGAYPKNSELMKVVNAEAAFDRGRTAILAKDFATAETEFTEVIRINPTSELEIYSLALYNLHLAQWFQSDLPGAIRSLETLEALLDNNPNLDRENTQGYVSLKQVRSQLQILRAMQAAPQLPGQ